MLQEEDSSSLLQVTNKPVPVTMEATAVQLLAPAKVNLSLRIERRRDDGFHELETFISPIALYDELEIQKSSTGITLNCDDPLVPQNDGNLVVRAANAFFSATALTGGAAITLRKNIPTGAGLGGGSSDAATALQALNQLYDTHLPREALAKMAEPIGSDVPFFVFQSAALCRGRGELISPQTLSERFSLLLLKPQFGVATPFAYRRWSESREIPDFVYGSQEYHGHTFINHLERPVFALPDVLILLPDVVTGQVDVFPAQW